MKKILSVAFLALLAVTAPSYAAIAKGNGEVGFDYGQMSYDSDTNLDSSDNLSVRGGYFMTDLFQIEGQYSTADSKTEVVPGMDVKASTDMIMVNGVFNFMPKKDINPFVLVGVGQSDVTVDANGISQDDSGTAYQIAAGSRFFFGKAKRAAFRLDVSMINQDTFNETQTNTTFAGGFTFKLGK